MVDNKSIEKLFKSFSEDDTTFSIIDTHEIYEFDGDDFKKRKIVYEVITNDTEKVQEFSKYISSEFIYHRT